MRIAAFRLSRRRPGADVYLVAFQFQWLPILKLQQGAEYTLHLSALDVNHGFSLYPINVNFQVVPGYDYGLRVTPNASGDFRIICNEFCGIGHHIMVGRVIVDPAPASAGRAGGGGGAMTAATPVFRTCQATGRQIDLARRAPHQGQRRRRRSSRCSSAQSRRCCSC